MSADGGTGALSVFLTRSARRSDRGCAVPYCSLSIAQVPLKPLFWASLFSLFPIAIGHYFGEAAAGGNYGVLYAIAKGSGGLYGGVLSAVLVTQHGFSFAIAVAGVMAIVAGLVIIPLKYSPPVWKDATSERMAIERR